MNATQFLAPDLREEDEEVADVRHVVDRARKAGRQAEERPRPQVDQDRTS